MLTDAQGKAAATWESTTTWRKEGAAFVNLLHPHHAGAYSCSSADTRHHLACMAVMDTLIE